MLEPLRKAARQRLAQIEEDIAEINATGKAADATYRQMEQDYWAARGKIDELYSAEMDYAKGQYRELIRAGCTFAEARAVRNKLELTAKQNQEERASTLDTRYQPSLNKLRALANQLMARRKLLRREQASIKKNLRDLDR